MRQLVLIVLIALAIIFCLVTSSDGTTTDKSNLVKRKQDTPYRTYGLYNYKNKKKKKNKQKEDNSKRHIKRNDDPDKAKDPELGEVDIKEEDKALLFKREVPVSTGQVLSTDTIHPGGTTSHP